MWVCVLKSTREHVPSELVGCGRGGERERRWANLLPQPDLVLVVVYSAYLVYHDVT